jgi:CheY-like chemotaxis protein
LIRRENNVPLLLIVDDDADQMQRFSAAASDAGFCTAETKKAASEEEAYALLRAHNFQLAIVDLMLTHPPDREEGLRVIARLRKEQPDCRILAITTKVGTDSGIRCLEAGAHDFISSKWADVNYLELLYERLRLWKGVIDRGPGDGNGGATLAGAAPASSVR